MLCQLANNLPAPRTSFVGREQGILEKLGLPSPVQVVDWTLAQGFVDSRPE